MVRTPSRCNSKNSVRASLLVGSRWGTPPNQSGQPDEEEKPCMGHALSTGFNVQTDLELRLEPHLGSLSTIRHDCLTGYYSVPYQACDVVFASEDAFRLEP